MRPLLDFACVKKVYRSAPQWLALTGLLCVGSIFFYKSGERFWGSLVFQQVWGLISMDGHLYVMQSMSSVIAGVVKPHAVC